ncbi:MAG: hypothetical protein JO157_13630 [Acetobacteraceae bacterium]|nr:hypothetical protein [Acetobacteraceae bacterium]
MEHDLAVHGSSLLAVSGTVATNRRWPGARITNGPTPLDAIPIVPILSAVFSSGVFCGDLRDLLAQVALP